MQNLLNRFSQNSAEGWQVEYGRTREILEVIVKGTVELWQRYSLYSVPF